MKTRRILFAFFAVAGILGGMIALTAHSALAQTWPTRPMTLVVPFGAGGSPT